MIKVIVFDLGNVIIPFDFSICCRGLAQASGWTAEEIYRDAFGTRLVHDYEQGRLSSREFHQEVCRRLGLELGFAEFSRMWGVLPIRRTKPGRIHATIICII